ncbi:MAG: tetraacyldisaccharide 4'-kinase [Pseudomonadota bacterium]
MKQPRFWSGTIDPRAREAAPLTRFLLTPLAWVYAAVTARKIKTRQPREVSALVLCVGNLTAGGVGKSPVVHALRKRLTEMTGQRAASLSRGYGGQLKGPLKVDLGLHSARDVGDEPAMLAGTGESWIGAARDLAGSAMRGDGVEIIIMDDGHQNPGLKKDFTFVVIDSADPFGNGFVIPKGPLREPVQAGLERADAVIMMGDGDTPEAVTASGLPVLRAHIRPTAKAPDGPLVAFAGIGRPEKLFDSLTALGADLKDAVPFDDHHVYTAADLSYLRRLAGDHGARLVTTEKDFARLGQAQREGIVFLPVEAHFDDDQRLDKLLQDLLDRRP